MFGIHDADYLEAHAAGQVAARPAERHRPVQARHVGQGQPPRLSAYDGYWGDTALTPNVEFRWSDEAAQRLLELQSGNVDGIDNPGADDIPTIQGDSALKFNPREG